MKLLILEVPDDDIDYVIGKLDLEACALVHELPTTEELGRVAHEVWMHQSSNLPSTEREFLTRVGEAILAALRTASPAPGKS